MAKQVDQDMPNDDVGALNSILGFHIRLAHGAVYRHFMETFASLGLTQKQVSVMWLVQDHPAIAQTDLGRRLQMDRATTNTLINRLEERAFLTRGKSLTDGRKQVLTLTAEGVAILAEAKRVILEHERWLKDRFTAREVTQLIKLLARIHE